MAKCVFCDKPLTPENAHLEHVIPNALGGRLQSRELDCVGCNATCGADCDAAIAHDLNPYANLLEIERHRGEPQPIQGTHKGKAVKLLPGGKSELVRPECDAQEGPDGRLTIRLVARSKSEARRLLEGLKRKYPKLDVEKAMAAAQIKSEYSNEFIHFNFTHGGDGTFRAVMKIAFLFFKLKQPGTTLPGEETLIAYIKGEVENSAVSFYCPEPEIVARTPGQVLHTLILKSYPKEKLLVAFVDLFNVLPFVVLLSDNFTDDLEERYVIDLLERREVTPAALRLPVLDRQSLLLLLNEMPSPSAKIELRMKEFLTITMPRQQGKHLSGALGEAVEGYLKQFPEGTLITPEMIREMVDKIMEKVEPIITRTPRDQ